MGEQGSDSKKRFEVERGAVRNFESIVTQSGLDFDLPLGVLSSDQNRAIPLGLGQK